MVAEGNSSTFTDGDTASAAIWSGPRSRAMSASPVSTRSRRVPASGTFLRMSVLSLGTPAGDEGFASRISASRGMKRRILKGPLPAEWLFSHRLPASDPSSCASTVRSSRIEATGRGENIQDHRGAEFRRPMDLDPLSIEFDERGVDVGGRPAELVENKCRRAIQF